MLRMSFYFPNFGTVIFRLYMLKKELRKILLSLSFVFVAAVSCAQYVVTGGSGSPMKASQSSGDSAERLEVYLVYGMDNVTISYTSSSSSSHQWYRYKTKRLEAEKVASTQNGTTSTIRNVEEGYGYFVEEGAVSRYVWIVDYSKYTLNISNLHVSDNSDPCRLGQVRSNLFIIIGRIREQDVNCLANLMLFIIHWNIIRIKKNIPLNKRRRSSRVICSVNPFPLLGVIRRSV